MSGFTAEKELRAVVSGLRGQRLAEVVYYPLASGTDGREIEQWDFGDWHTPTMGVELITDIGHRYSAIWIWDNTFTCYGLEVFQQPMTDFLTSLGAPWGSVAVPASDHPRWARLINKPIHADTCWDSFDEVRVSTAVRLGSGTTVVWIAAGRPADPESATTFHLNTDDVMVVFTSEIATQAGIPASS